MCRVPTSLIRWLSLKWNMSSSLPSLHCFRMLPKGILVHYVSALQIRGIGKKKKTRLTPCNFISFPSCYHSNSASLSPSLLPLAYASLLGAASPESRNCFCLVSCNWGALHAVEELLFSLGLLWGALYINHKLSEIKASKNSHFDLEKAHAKFKQSATVHCYVLRHNIHSWFFLS